MKTLPITHKQSVARTRQTCQQRAALCQAIQDKFQAVSVELLTAHGKAGVWMEGHVGGGIYYPKLNQTCIRIDL